MFKVYILFSKQRSRYYVGQTSDIEKRIEKHNMGLVKSTRLGVPWEIVLLLETKTRSEAMLLERKIKKRGAKRYIDDLFGV